MNRGLAPMDAMVDASDQYAVALSFASEDEALVRGVYRYLRSHEINAFFAPSKISQLWGKDEHEFERIYGPGSRYVVPFISEHYIRKEWPRLEFRAARKEARIRDAEFILPVRVDDTALPGLRRKTQYVDARQHTPKEIAAFLIEKLEADVRTSDAAPIIRRPRKQIRMLRDDERELLGLLATVPLPLPTAHLRALVPEGRWATRIPRWRSLGIVTSDVRGFDDVDSRLRRQLLADKPAATRWRERWVALLAPLQMHTDTGLMLALELIGLRRVGEAVDVLASIAVGLEPGFWNSLYLTTFSGLAGSTFVRSADSAARVKFHNAYGVVLSRNGDHREALAQFTQLRALSRRGRNAWGEGQSYINAGVAAAGTDDVPAAMAWYKKAAAFGKKHRDYVLAGRAVGNMANFVGPAAATELLEESERFKLRGGDIEGLAGTAVVRGNVAVQQADLVGAARHYRHAVQLARKLDLLYLRAVASRSLAQTEAGRGRPKKAYPLYRESARICQAEGFVADHAHAVAGEALARMAAGEFARAGKLFEALAELHRQAGQREQAAVARHDVGAMFAARRRQAEAYRVFINVIREFKEYRVHAWVRRTQVDAATVAPDEGTAASLLRSARRGAASAKDFETLQRATVQLVRRRLDRNDVRGAVREMDIALRTLPSPLDLPLLADRFRFILESHHDRRVAPAFHRLVAVARAAHARERVIDAHMEAGDYLWAKESARERANAYQAYAVAMIEAGQLDEATLMKACMHIFGRLYAAAKREDAEVLTRLEEATHAWLRKQNARHASGLIQFTLWPLRLAARIWALPDHGRRLSKRKAQFILTEEFQMALGRAASPKRKTRVRQRVSAKR